MNKDRPMPLVAFAGALGGLALVRWAYRTAVRVNRELEEARLARAAPGCLDFVQAADQLDPTRINVYERWESKEHLAAHLTLYDRLAAEIGCSVAARRHADQPHRAIGKGLGEPGPTSRIVGQRDPDSPHGHLSSQSVQSS